MVITIIALLLSLLAPALEEAVYQAQLVDCATRLKVWANMGVMFAQDHQRRLPMAFGPGGTVNDTFVPDGLNQPRVLDRISDNADLESNGGWKVFGTPWRTWVKYGLNDKIAVCPIWKGTGTLSSGFLSYNPANPHPQHFDSAIDQFAGWGPQVWIGYQWMAGTGLTRPTAAGGGNYFAWGGRPPAGRMTDATSSSVVASDLLYMNSGWASPPTNFRAIAHPSTDNLAQPRTMGIAFADVHVEIEREGFFETPQIFGDTGSPDPSQYSYQGGASYYWWGK